MTKNPTERLRTLKAKRDHLQKQIDDAYNRTNISCPITAKKFNERMSGMYAALVHFDKQLKLTANQIIGRGCWVAGVHESRLSGI
jgi:malate synthase